MDAPAAVGSRRTAGWFGLYVRGLAMGIAEVVPGVSGGTIAFVSGIYQELIDTIAGLRPSAVVVLVRQGPRAFWHTHNLSFLLVLGAGMLTGIIIFSQLIATWLAVARPVVWAFFFGVIACSILVLGQPRERRKFVLFAPLGVLAGVGFAQLEPVSSSAGLWLYFVAGVIAVSAWLLPAISGSFVLLIMGLYEGVIGALAGFQWPILFSLAAGCTVGLLAFANLLSWLLHRYSEMLFSLLTGFMAGSLLRLWPWTVDRALSPEAYTVLTGQNAWLVESVFAALGGAIVVYLLTRLE